MKRFVPLCLLLAGIAVAPALLSAQPSKELAKELLKTPARPARPALPPSTVPLQFLEGERIAFLGNSLAERMNLFGHFEAMLHTGFPDKKLIVRNFARPAEEVGIHQRSSDYTALDDPQFAFGADTYICFFGFNESFAGPTGVDAFKTTYKKFLAETKKKYPRDDTKAEPRFILVSPIAFEISGNPLLPKGEMENQNLAVYAKAVKEVADDEKIAFIDLFEGSQKLLNTEPGLQLTINGCHLNDAGNAAVAKLIYRGMFGDGALSKLSAISKPLLDAVNDKSWVHLQDYRMLNGWYVYGGRRTWDTETFPHEYKKIREMAAVRDQYIWDLASGKTVAAQPDDSQTEALITPPTRFGTPGQKYSEADELRYLTPEQLVEQTTVPDGLQIVPFADETKFPEIAKPVQLNFDNKGRLWVACMPTYPQWKPGDHKPMDKLVILEDLDHDGKADKSTVFYDKLQCPTGFEFWNGGVLVTDQPRLLWLKDTDGDDKADEVVHLIDGWATDDTHHTCGAFEWSNGGLLHMLEGIATSTTLETPWGPHRSHGSGGAYTLDPRTLKINQFALPGQYNMWCYVFDAWGQGIVGDGTTANHAWDTPLSGEQFRGRMGLKMVFNQEGMRPALGCEWLYSRHLPDNIQGQFTYACVINMNGMPRFTMGDDGGGFHGNRIKDSNGKPDDLIRSSDKHFRPADPQIGPDGALWFGDWANALIGHMQYSQRDPNRDHTRGRIYRLVAKGRPLLTPVTQYGKSIPELLDQLKEYELRTRYRARRELNDRPTAEVAAGVKAWVVKLDPKDPEYDRLRVDAAWILAAHHAIDPALLTDLLKSKDARARAAVTHIIADHRDEVPGAFDLLVTASQDDHPRVRTEAARGLSYYDTPAASNAAMAMLAKPADYWADYTIRHALAAHEGQWRGAYLTGKMPAPERSKELVNEILSASKAGAAALPFLKTLLSQEQKPAEERNKAMTGLAGLGGDANRGREVFVRNCTSCHRVGNGEGRDYGPNLAGVAKRMPKVKIVESVIDPNAEVDPKYRATLLITSDGVAVSGLVTKEDDKEIEIFDGKITRKIPKSEIDERAQQTSSSMPEGTASSIAPAELIDLLEYLGSQTQDTKK